MKNIRISSDALSDLNEGFLFYEQQDTGLGDYFTSCLRSDIEELRLTGGVHRVVHRHFYRSLSRVFPYGIFYTSDEKVVTVYAVVDLRRDPEFIRRHLEETKLQPREDRNG
ncbi:type II toxin-antitoxin system RelE/ParE family toxin [Coraliomargarita sp. W4R53]